jgi:hypothetical protein
LGRIPPYPLFLRKSAKAIEAKRVPQHSLFQERGESAEAIENKELIFSLFFAEYEKREARMKHHPTPP